MLFAYFTLFVALIISAVAEYYSIVGLTSIFSTVFWPIVIMGAVLGVGKITAAVWLKLNWDRASFTYKLYLVPAVAFLMLLTSMGIFGFLSKAHSDQSLVSGDSMSKVAIFDEKIKTATDNIDTNRKAIAQMNAAVDQTLSRSTNERGATNAVYIRQTQARERTRLQNEIAAEQKTIASLSEQRAPLAAEFRKIEAEVGPIKYIAAMMYGDNPDANLLEKAVRLVIMLIVAVFDPLALVLILAAQQSLKWARHERDSIVDEKLTAEILAVEDVEPIAQSVPIEPQPTIEPAYEADDGPLTNEQLNQIKESVRNYDYLKTPFVHFKNLTPMVAPLNVITDDVAAMGIDPEPPGVVFRNFTPAEWAAVNAYNDERLVSKFDKQQLSTPDVTKYNGPMKEVVEEHIDENTRIKTFNHTWVPDLAAYADNVDTANAANADFGTKFPDTANKGDMHLRVDFLPARLFKYNGAKWIEIDKKATDSYTFNEEYIKYLINKINSGEYDVETLSDSEQEQIRDFLGKQ